MNETPEIDDVAFQRREPMRRSLVLAALLLGSCSESHGMPDPICTTFVAGSGSEWWVHHAAPDGSCLYAVVHDAREAPESLLRSLDQEGPYGVDVFVRAEGPCDVEVILPPVGNSMSAHGWVRSRDVDGHPDVEMDVVVDFPEYAEEGTPAVTYRMQVSGTEPTPRGRCGVW